MAYGASGTQSDFFKRINNYFPNTKPTPKKPSTSKGYLGQGTTPVTAGGSFVVNRTAGPGGNSTNMTGSNEWMNPSKGIQFDPGEFVRTGINNAGLDWGGTTLGSVQKASTGANPYSTSTYGSSGYGSSGGGYGSSGGGGGGGSAGYSGPLMDQATFDAILAQIRGTRPGLLDFEALDLPDYKAPSYQSPEFYDFDRSQYDMMLGELPQAYASDLALGRGAYADARTELNQYQDPYSQGASTLDPGISEAMSRMFAANGTPTGALTEQDRYAQQSNDAMQATFAMLSGAANQRQAGNQRALSGDQRRFTEGLNAEKRQTGLGINMALANALQAYNKDKFAYGSDENRFQYGVAANEAQTNYGTGLEEAMANYTRQNQVGDTNTTNTNTWNMSTLQPIIDLISSGLFDGKQSLDLAGLGA